MIKDLVEDRMKSIFYDNLPMTLYLSHYEFADRFDGSPDQWRRFLREPEINRFIEKEMASIAEAQARRALHTLSRAKALTAQDIAALKQVIENSKLLKQKSQSKTQIVVMHTPSSRPTFTPEVNDDDE